MSVTKQGVTVSRGIPVEEKKIHANTEFILLEYRYTKTDKVEIDQRGRPPRPIRNRYTPSLIACMHFRLWFVNRHICVMP